MPPRRKPDAAAAKIASLPRPQISKLHWAAEGDTAFPRPAPPEAMASGEDNDGRTHAADNVASPRDSARGHPRRSGERGAARVRGSPDRRKLVRCQPLGKGSLGTGGISAKETRSNLNKANMVELCPKHDIWRAR